MTPRCAAILWLSLAALAPGVAFADDDNEDELWFGSFGLGVVRSTARDARADYGFDGTFRVGRTGHATRRLRLGGFVEIRTVDFETFEAAGGPQLQLRFGDSRSVVLRAGVGSEAEGDSYGLFGFSFKGAVVGASVAARRTFDRETALSVNFEFSGLVLLFPAFAHALR